MGKIVQPCESRRTWNSRFATKLQRLTGCKRRQALAIGRACTNWREIDPEQAAIEEAEYQAEDAE